MLILNTGVRYCKRKFSLLYEQLLGHYIFFKFNLFIRFLIASSCLLEYYIGIKNIYSARA